MELFDAAPATAAKQGNQAYCKAPNVMHNLNSHLW